MASKKVASKKMGVRFGLISDIQYCDTDDAASYSGREWRNYRNVLKVVREGIMDWNKRDIQFVVNLGDMIDGKNNESKKSQQAICLVLDEFKRLPERTTIINLIGNHELYNFTRVQIQDFINKANPYTSSKGSSYYTFRPVPNPAAKWVVIVLDSYQEHTINVKEDSPQYQAGQGFLKEREQFKERHIVPPGGSLGNKQRLWLKDQLEAAEMNRDKVIVLSHVPIGPNSCSDDCLAWDYDVTFDLFKKYPCVTACFAGHDHVGGYRYTEGIHFFTMPSPLLVTEENPHAHAIVEITEHSIFIECNGAASKILGGDRVEFFPHVRKRAVSKEEEAAKSEHFRSQMQATAPQPTASQPQPTVPAGPPRHVVPILSTSSVDPNKCSTPIHRSNSKKEQFEITLGKMSRLKLFKLAKEKGVANYRSCKDDDALRELLKKSV